MSQQAHDLGLHVGRQMRAHPDLALPLGLSHGGLESGPHLRPSLPCIHAALYAALHVLPGPTMPCMPALTDELFAHLYAELRALARAKLRLERPGHTLSATSLTHEAYERLAAQRQGQWESRGHFLALAATMMRRILVDHALAKSTVKRQAELVTLSAAEWVQDDAAATPFELLDLHRALVDFEALDQRAARVVELRYFGGLEVEEIAAAMEVSPATVKRDWAVARAWLKQRLAG